MLRAEAIHHMDRIRQKRPTQSRPVLRAFPLKSEHLHTYFGLWLGQDFYWVSSLRGRTTMWLCGYVPQIGPDSYSVAKYRDSESVLALCLI